MAGHRKIAIANITMVICFTVGLLCIFALGVWLVFQFGFIGANHKWIFLRACIWLAEITSLILFYRRPSIMAAVGLCNMAFVITGVYPWEEPGIQNFFFQFMFDIAFFAAGSTGALVRIISRHQISKTTALTT